MHKPGSRANDKLKQIFQRKAAGLLTAILIITAAGGFVCALAKLRPALIEDYYRPFSRFILQKLSDAAALVPFSVAEILLYIAAAILAVAFLRLIYVMLTGRRRISYLVLFMLRLVLTAVILGFLFYALWGLNYGAESLSLTLGLDVKERKISELVELNEYLVARANELAVQIERGVDGLPADKSFDGLAESVAERFGEITGHSANPAKYIIASVPLSYAQITGIFIPFTGEANVNSNNVSSDLPFCIAHEIAHRYAIAPEDEANFFAFYVLYNSDDVNLAYSAYLAAVRYCQNALYYVSYDEFARVYGMYSLQLRNDLGQYRDHWNSYEGKTAEVFLSINNGYLVLQGESDGISSYGKMVNLMLAWFETK